MTAQFHEYIKNHWIVYFKWVHFMAYEIYLNKKGNKSKYCFKIFFPQNVCVY